MTSPTTSNERFETRVRKSSTRLGLWSLAWVASSALLGFGHRLLWSETPAITWVALGINLLIGIGVVVANRQHLQQVDEMQRKIMFDAMAITLGVGLIVGVPWSLLNVRDEIEHLLLVMGVTFAVAVFLAQRRYR